MKCPFCNYEISDGAKFCPDCGKALPHDRPSENDKPENPADSCSEENASDVKSSAGVSVNFQKKEKPDCISQDESCQKNGDPELKETVRRLDRMNLMQIVCLIALLIPGVNIAGLILLLIIIIRSFDLSARTGRVLRRFGYEKYARISDGIKTKCTIILLSTVLLITAGCMAFTGFCHLSIPQTTLAVITGVIMMIIATNLELYCFIRLYTIMNVMDAIVCNRKHPEKPGFGMAVTVMVTVCLFMILISGVAITIGMPVYIQHIKNNIFTDMMMQANNVKRNALICVAEYEYRDFAEICDNTRDYAEGFGWKLYPPHQYATEYVDSIEVTSASADKSRNGYPEIKVTVNASRKYFSEAHPKITYVGTVIDDDIIWKLDIKETTILPNIASPWSVWDIR